MKFFQKNYVTGAILTFMPMFAIAEAEGDKRGILELIKTVDELFIAGGSLGYSLAMLLGIFLSVIGILTFALAGKTQDQSKTKSIAIITLICGICLGSISGIMNMGSVEITDSESEYVSFGDEDA